MKQTSPVIEDYLKTIYAHTEWQSDPITPSVLAAKLSLAPSSVTEMVKKLAASGLVSHVKYGSIELTDAGREQAVAVVRRHRLVETWLVTEMGYSWDAVHDEAEVLEHALSDRLLDAIDERLGRPDRDPHGDPIPDASGFVRREASVLLAEANPGHDGVVLRINDRDPSLLRDLGRAGVGVGLRMRVVSTAPLRVAVANAELDLPEEAGSAMWVSA